MKTFVALTCLLALVSAVAADNWAVLVAGSNTYGNYRHQADICHAYHILSNNGIPDDKIIVFMYDDIANNEQNPKKGTIINKPNGPNVYPGVPKDYTGADVTPENFLSVLQGKDMGGKKTLKSTAEDNVFIYFADHGGTGLIAFPSEYLYSNDLMSTLKGMAPYKELVFYMEACESGSMFAAGLLPDNIHIYATTAANPDESSYACYYDDTYQTYLGDCYSVDWMEDAEANDPSTETLLTNFNTVKGKCTTSHVCAYGDTSIQSEVFGNFIAAKKATRVVPANKVAAEQADMTDSRDVELAILQKRWMSASYQDRQPLEEQMKEVIESRQKADNTFTTAAKQLLDEKWRLAFNARALGDDTCNAQSVNQDCLKKAVQGYEASCGKFNDYSLKYVKNLANMCDMNVEPEMLSSVFAKLC